MPLFETIGPDLLASMVEKVAAGKEKSNDELFTILETAAETLSFTERQIANLPSRRDLYRAVSYLAEQADKNQQQVMDSLDEIKAELQTILAGRPSVSLFHGVPDMPNYFLGRAELVDDLAARRWPFLPKGCPAWAKRRWLWPWLTTNASWPTLATVFYGPG